MALLVGIFVGVLAVVSYLMSHSTDPGVTTEVALMSAYVLGLLTQSELSLAASLGVVVTVLLASREALHHFVREKLSDEKFQDTLILWRPRRW